MFDETVVYFSDFACAGFNRHTPISDPASIVSLGPSIQDERTPWRQRSATKQLLGHALPLAERFGRAGLVLDSAFDSCPASAAVSSSAVAAALALPLALDLAAFLGVFCLDSATNSKVRRAVSRLRG